jgi:hypothetical protein
MASRQRSTHAPEDAETLNARANSVRAQGGPEEEAVALYERALSLDGGFWKANYNLAFLIAKRDPRRAITLLDRTISANPQFVGAYALAAQVCVPVLCGAFFFSSMHQDQPRSNARGSY